MKENRQNPAPKDPKDKKDNFEVVATHREARHDYHVLDVYETGMALVGCEVKSLRDSQCSLAGSFARFEGGDLYLWNTYIAPYDKGNRENPDSRRQRKLLLHRSELNKLYIRTREKGLLLIPLRIYFNKRGMAKLELALAQSKKHEDQRADIKERDARRQMSRDVKNRNRK
jgi:SsrA-binding protein